MVVRGRWELAHERALISWGPRCMQACSGELRSAIRSVIEQCTASHVSIVASKRRVGHILSYLMEQYFLCFFSSVGVPGNLPIFGESGGISRLYQLAEWFGPCDLIAERDFISRRVLSHFMYHSHACVPYLLTGKE